MSDSERAETRRKALKRFMAVHGVESVNAWAKEAGVSESGVRAFLNGDTDSMNMLTYEKLAEAKDSTLSDILGLDLPTTVTRGPSATHKVTRRPRGLETVHGNVKSSEGSAGAESRSLAGIERGGGQAEGARALRPRVEDLAETVMIPELDVRASAGGGASDPVEIGTDVRVVAEWQVPAAWAEQMTPGPAPDVQPNLKFITNVGDSMDPLFPPNSKLMVNIADRVPTPPGPFVIFDGLGLVVKRVEYIPHSDPPTVEISSVNPAYKPYRRVLGEAYIQGRVVGRWQAT